MKKMLHKLRNLRKKDSTPLPLRITTDTISHHREQILAGGRKFKYPLQYARHRLVINAILISLAALVIVTAVGWWQLYPSQNTSEFFYRIAKVIPLPVAVVDGQPVLYSDYLMKYRSSVHYLEQIEQVDLKTADGKKQVEYIKQKSMSDSIADAYALKLSKSMGVTVSNTELEIFLQGQRQSSDGDISKQTYDAVILDYYDWSPSEYEHVTEGKLLRQKVAYAMDKGALNTADKVVKALKTNSKTDFNALASVISAQSNIKVVSSVSGWVPKANQDGGLSIEAAKLNKLATSAVIKSTIGNGYYIVKLIDINDAQVNYEYIQIPITVFDNALQSVIDNKKVQKYISI